MELSQYLSLLNKNILYMHLTHKNFDDSAGFLILELPEEISGEVKNYIISADTLPVLLERGELPNDSTLFIAGDPEIVAERPGLNLVVTDLPLYVLSNILNRRFQQIALWRSLFTQDIWSSRNPVSLIHHIAELLRVPVFLLNHQLQAIHSDENFPIGDACIHALSDGGKLDPSTLLSFHEEYTLSHHRSHYTTIDKNLCIFMRSKSGAYPSFLMIVLPFSVDTETAQTLLDVASEFISQQFSALLIDQRSTHMDLASLMAAFEHDNMTVEDIRSYLSKLRHPPCRFYKIFVISFFAYRDAPIPYHFIVQRLERIFPKQNIAIYDRQVIVLYCTDHPLNPGTFDAGPLEDFLEAYNATALAGPPASDWTQLYRVYSLTKELLQVLQSMHPNSSKRFFWFEDNSSILAIHLCRKALSDSGFDDEYLIYATHPAIVTLTIHDTLCNDDLCKVLYHYLLSGSKSAVAAKTLFMHRNTVHNKIEQATRIMGIDLTVPRLQFDLLFSITIHMYLKDYLHKNFHASTKDAQDPTVTLQPHQEFRISLK